MKKKHYFIIAVIGLLLSFGIWGGPLAWIVLPMSWFPEAYIVGFVGTVLMLVGGIGFLIKK